MTKVLRFATLLVSLLLTGLTGWGQTTIFSENVGTPTATTTLTNYNTGSAPATFQNKGVLIFDKGAQTNPCDIRISSASTGYSGASGGGNIYLTATNAAYGFSIEDIDASAYTGLTLTYAYRKESATAFATFAVDYWNGTAWVSVANTAGSLFSQAANASIAWYVAKTLTLPSGAQISTLKIRFVKTGSVAIRLDDFKLTGTAAATTPTLTTPTATSLTNDGGTLGATITADGGSAILDRGTVWGTSAAPTSNSSSEGGTAVAAFSHSRSGMGPNVEITYRGWATNAQGTDYSPDGSFWTLANVPSAPTVNNPSTSSLDVVVNVNSNPASTEFAIHETTTNKYVQAGGTLGASAVWQTNSTWGTKTVTGLASSTTYTFEVKARNGDNTETAFSSTANGTTSASGSPPSINSSLTDAGIYKTAYSYFITATNTPTSYGATGLPAGLSINTGTGEISGSPTTIVGSPFNVGISATNANGTDNETLVLTIDKKNLTITGISIATKTYDATNAATISGTPALNGVVAPDVVTVGGGSATFNSVNAGGTVATTISGYTLGGSEGGNYTVTQPSGLTGVINAKNLTMSGLSVLASKVYDGNTTAVVTGGPGSLQGAEAPGAGTTSDGKPYTSDAVSTTGTAVGTYDNANVASATQVAYSGLSLTGSGFGNYTLTIQSPSAATITKANQTITFGALGAKNTASGSPFTLTATASSGLTVSYQSSNTLVITVATNQATIVGAAGNSDITAKQAGDGNYNAAPDVIQNQVVTSVPVTLAAWDFFGQSSPATFAATTYNANLVFVSTEKNITRGSGAASSAGGNSFRTVGFTNDGIATTNTDYFQVTLQAVSGKALSLSAIDANFIGTASFYASPGVTSRFAYSLDGTNFTLIGSNVQSTSLTMGQIDLTGVSALQNVANGTNITFRYYASGQTGTGGWGFSSPSSGTNGLAISGYVVNPCSPPASQASSVTTTNITTTGVDAGYTRGTSNGSILAIRPTSISEVVPAQGATYTGNTNWNTADQINASNRVLNNSTAAASSVVAVNGVSNLNSETQYTLTGYEYSTASGVCYNTSSAPTATFYTYSLEPGSHSTSFTTTACNNSSLLLNFNSVTTSSISNADGYVILFTSDGSTPSSSGVLDGTAPGAWTLTGTTAYLTTINSTATNTYNHTSLTPGGTYKYLLIPYNADAGTNAGTYNYYIGGSPATATGTVGNASANSNLVEETSYRAGATNIAYGNYQAATITNTTGCLPVFGLRLRDGGGAADADANSTILKSITFNVNSVAQSAVRRYALFLNGGTTPIAEMVNPGTATVTFSGLAITANDNLNQDFALWASFNNTSGAITDNAQMSFSVTNADVTSDCATASSQFSNFTASSAVTGDINRLEVNATQISFGTPPTDGVYNINLAPFTVRFEDANGVLDFDNNRTVTLTTTGANISPATPSVNLTAIHSGIATFSAVQYTTGPQTGITITANTSGLTTNTVVSGGFNISAVVYTTNDYRTVTGGTWSTQINGTATFEKWNGSTWASSGRPTATTHNIFIRHALTSNGAINLNNMTIDSAGSLSFSSGGGCNYIEIKKGGTLTKNSVFAVVASATKNFVIQSGGKLVIQDASENGFTATSNASTIWDGNEDFKPGSTVEIQRWGANNATTANRMVFNGTNISTNTYSGYTAAFGDLTINLVPNFSLAGALVLISGGVTANLAHGNVTFKSADNIADVVLSSTGAVTSGIGGNFIVDAGFATSSPSSQINLKSSSNTLDFTIKGGMQLNSATTRLGSVPGAKTTLTVEGNLNLASSSILEFSSNTSSTNYHVLNLMGDLTVGASALLQNSNTSRRGFFNFSGTGDGLTAATTQTIDIATTVANENRYISFNVNNGAFTQLVNRDLQLGDSSSMTVANGGVLDFNFTGATANNITEVGGAAANTAFTLATGGKIKISNAEGIDAGVALVGNVRLDNRTYSTTGIYHYIGKTPSQRLGDGLPGAVSGKYVIVELDALGTNLLFEGWSGAANVTTGNILLDNTGNGLKIIQGTVSGTTTADFTNAGKLEMTGGLYKINVPGATSIVPQLSGAYTLTGGTIELNGTAAQSLRGSRNYFNLTMSSVATPTSVIKNTTDNIGVNGDLLFTMGVLTANPYKVTIGATGSVTGALQTTGWVHGYLEKNVATGSGVLRDFEIGDATNYTPVNLNFASVSATNNLTASTVAADHANIATSRLTAAKSVNRNWTISNSGVSFTTYSANFNFKTADLDAGTNTAQLSVAKFNTPLWSYPATVARTANSTQLTGATSFSDFQIGEVDTFEWNGTVSNAWTTEQNWSPTGVPAGCPDHIIIPAGTPFSPTISVADVSVGNVDIASSAILTLQGKNLNVCGNWFGGTATTNASVLGTGVTFLNSVAGAQTVSGKTRFNTLQINNTSNVSLLSSANVSIGKGLHLQAGDFDVTAGVLRLLSTSSHNNSYIDNFSFGGFPGTLTGSILADRYIPVTGRNQHFISSPLNTPALSQIGASGPDSSYITPTGDCDEYQSQNGSAYGSVFLYDDGHRPNGYCMLGNWMVKTSGNMENGQGYSAYLTGNSILTLSGVANSGDMSVPVKNSGYGTVNTKQAQPVESGWNLIGNPYPSAIDLTISRAGSGFSNQVQVWQTTGPFRGSWQPVIINGISGKVVIPPFQGFMIRRTGAGNSNYPFYQSERSRHTDSAFYRNDADNSLRLVLDYNGIKDATTVEFNAVATDSFDNEYDANKSGAIGRPTLYTHLNTNMWYSINTLTSITQTATVPVGLRPEASGMMSLTAQGLSSFDPTTYVFIEDKMTGLWHNLRNGDYTFSANQNDDQDRFVLHFTPPAQILATDVSCSESGVISIEQPGSANWTYTIEDQNSIMVSTGMLNAANHVGVNVVAGVYTVTLVDNNGYTVIKNVQVNGVQPIIAAFSPSTAIAQTGDDITFTATTTAALYIWDFGDGTSAITATANHQYQSEGVYMVQLTVMNAEGCQSVTTQSITITSRSSTGIGQVGDKSGIQIWSAKDYIYVDFGKQVKVNADIELYNLIGQLISHEKFGRSFIYSKAISNISAAYLIVKVTNDDKILTKKVFVGR